jgi:lysophospholipase L1-like esterase
MKVFKVLALLFFIFAVNKSFAQTITNGDFDTSGLQGWTCTSGVSTDAANAQWSYGKCAKLARGTDSIYQKVTGVVPLSIWYTMDPSSMVYVKTSDANTQVSLFIYFYNAKDSLLMSYVSTPTTATSSSYKGLDVNLLVPVTCSYAKVGVKGYSSNTGSIYVDNCASVIVKDETVKPTTVDLKQYMRPFWASDTIYSETVLMYQPTGASTYTGNLLFTPKSIISVQNYSQTKTYTNGTDYSVSGNTITQVGNQFTTDKQNLTQAYLNSTINSGCSSNCMSYLPGRCVVVTYVPERDYSTFASQTLKPRLSSLPRTAAKLSNKQPLNIVALGMSITRGFNVSSYSGDAKSPAQAPYMPPYNTLFATELSRLTGSTVTMNNAGMPGMDSKWMVDNVQSYVNPLKPDLVILDMGMNDIWFNDSVVFKTNMQNTISKIKAKCPNAEFILLSNMLFDPGYTLSTLSNPDNMLKRMYSYNRMNKSLEAAGIICVDMTTISHILYSKKKPKDCVSNALHPNDYLARWYAQALVSQFVDFHTSVDNVYDYSNFVNIYPNPVSEGNFSVDLGEIYDSSNAQLSFFDITGKLITNVTQSSRVTDYKANNLNLDKGIYIVNIKIGDKVANKKLLINN